MTHLRLLIIAILTFTFLTALHAEPLGTAFTYQGQLVQSGTEVTDVCDFNFGLWDSRTNGTEVAEAFDSPNVNVNEGIFSVELDFGSRNFDGNPRWLEIAVVCPAGGGALTTLAPRQVLTATPYALFASEAGNSAGANFDTAASSSGVALTTADAIIASVTITAPAAGLVIVNANGWFNLKNSVSNHARCSVTTAVFVETATAISGPTVL